MKNRAADNPDEYLLLPSVVFQMVVALADSERRGYAIMHDIATADGRRTATQSKQLYDSLQRILEQGLIEDSDERSDPELDD